MSDLISRLSELRSQYNCFDENERDAYHTLSDAIGALKEQKTGHWIHKPFAYQCSTCGEDSDWPSEYCPWCGAKMGEEQ